MTKSIATATLILTSWATTVLAVSPAPQLSLEVLLAESSLSVNQPHTTYMKVGLTGFRLDSPAQRPAVNVALVIDKSGSMRGAKIEKAKQAAIAAIDRLRPDDILSVVVYHDGVKVVLPATKLRDKTLAKSAIRSITADGSTALFAGLSKGVAEVRKYLDDARVNRILLLSDGRANVGPDSPSELSELGRSLLKENIAVTTLGLGLDFNEDLMTQLALPSNGNHLFVEAADDLAATFDHEFNDILSVVAQDIEIDISLDEGFRPLRVLDQEADIHGSNIAIQWNQVYAEQERFVLVELEVTPAPKSRHRVGQVAVQYFNMHTKTTEHSVASAFVEMTDDSRQLAAATNPDVAEKAALLLANENNRRATALRDQGKVDEALRLLVSNQAYLSQKAEELNSRLLSQQGNLNQFQAANMSLDWKRTRKLMVRDNTAVQQQASGYAGNKGGDDQPSTDAGYSAYGGGYVKVPNAMGSGNSQLIKIPQELVPPRNGSESPQVPKE